MPLIEIALSLNMTNGLLFIYGTLLQRHNEFGAVLLRDAIFYGKGQLQGILYDFGDYPGAVYDPESGYTIFGNILRLKKPAETIKMLDGYEGFGEDEPQPNLFVRETISIKLRGATLPCWVYLYNLSVAGAPQILSGDYLEYIAKLKSLPINRKGF